MKNLSKGGIARCHRVLSGYVERGDLPGLVAVVSCHGDLHVETLGTLAMGEPAPMRHDTIFRIASMTKPIAAAAAMLLIEECRLRLDDSIEPWLPELADRRVLRTLGAALDDTVPARRAITVRDLLTFRMGFGSVMAPPGTHPIQQPIRDLRVGGDGPPLPSQLPAADEWLRRLGSLPWMAQPGERWMYHVSADVLGLLIARVSGRSLGAFLAERLFAPLGMKDTAFHVPAAKRERFPAAYRFNGETRALDLHDAPAATAWGAEPPLESAGGGLVSTADDYLTFARMMLNGGRHGGEQILSPAAVALMTTDQLTAEQRIGAEVFFGDYRSWGFGMAVDTRRNELYRTPGRFGWDGGYGTSAYIDPAQGVIGILLTQRMMESPVPPDLFSDFWNLAYAAIS